MWNGTNDPYAVDVVVDGQQPTWGPDWGTGTTGYVFQGRQNTPTWPATGVGYINTYPFLESSRTFTLLALNPRIPNRAADSHTVRYRLILGPVTADRGTLPASGWYETTVTGCRTATTTTLTAPATAELNTPVDLSVAVSPTTAGGTVQFYDNGVAIGEPVPVVDGAATPSHTFTLAGDHAITATFTPADPGTTGTPYGPSTSAPVTVTVEEPVRPDPDPETGSLGALGSLGSLSSDGGSGVGGDGQAGSSGSLATWNGFSTAGA